MQQLLFDKANKGDIWFRKEQCSYYLVDSEEKLSRLADILRKAKIISFDIETTGFNIEKDTIVGMSFCCEEGTAYYVPMDHYDTNNISEELLLSYLGDILVTIPIAGHNLKFDYKFVKKKYNMELNCKYDTFIIAKLLEEFDAVGLKYLCEIIFGFEVQELTPLLKDFGIGPGEMNMLKADELYEYCCQDTDLTLRLLKYFWIKLGWRPDYIYELEVDLIYCLAKMEMRGVTVDYEFLTNLRKEYTITIEELNNTIKDILDVPYSFNINSDVQLGRAFLERFPKMKDQMVYTKKTNRIKLDEVSVNKYITRLDAFLDNEGLDNGLNIFRHHSERKKLVSLLSKYINPWIEMIEENKTNIVHTNFNSLGTSTGRMSSNKPNMQNIAPKIRHAIVPRKGYYFLSMDYDQVEYRIIAGMAKIDHLIEEMNKSKADVHSIAASILFQIPIENVTKDIRKKAKTLNFGVLYGMGVYKLAENLSADKRIVVIAPDTGERYLSTGVFA